MIDVDGGCDLAGDPCLVPMLGNGCGDYCAAASESGMYIADQKMTCRGSGTLVCSLFMELVVVLLNSMAQQSNTSIRFDLRIIHRQPVTCSHSLRHEGSHPAEQWSVRQHKSDNAWGP